jgi:HD-GYP domain-containing protein (c-di-GMP phosphodiesterase class II)
VLTAFSVGAVAWFVTAVTARTIWTRQGRRTARRLVFLRAIGDWPAYAALFSSAALYAVTVGPMGLWAVPLAGLPYIFSHLSLHRLGDTRRTYDQTIGALGAIPEASGHVSPGHSGRCADLAVAVGAEMGLGISELRRIEYAALLHDIGRVVLGNSAMAQREYSFSDVSGWSAAIISEARYLEPVATIVASQHEPYRRPGEERDSDVPLGSQIVRIVARYDTALDDGTSAVEACELLHRGAAYDYDPRVVMALRRVLERRGILV